MAIENILQHWVFTRFVLPFLLVFFIVFAILEKTKIIGEGKKQLSALIAFVIGLIFVGVAYPTEVVGNLILFLTVALIVVFVTLLLWGFVIGGEAKISDVKWIKWIFGIGVVVVVVIALIWATGLGTNVVDILFKQNWSESLWTNVSFIVVIAIALALVLKDKSK